MAAKVVFLAILCLFVFCGASQPVGALPDTLSWGHGMPEPVSVELVDGELHVVWRQRSHAEYPVYPPRPVPDRVWKEIYVCGHDEIVLAETIQGTHTPAYEEPERLGFP